MNRGRIVEAWRRKRPLTGGTNGPDFIVVSNQDKLAVKGAAALLPLGDANALSLESAKERIPKAGTTPVIAGVCATDPLRLLDKFLQELKAAGVSGVQNAPSVGLIDGGFRTSLEEAKLGYAKEVELIRLAARLDLVTAALVFTADDARVMAEAGADAVVIHPGLGWKGPKPVEEIAAAAREVRKDVLVLGYGAAPAAGRGLDGIQTE
jgi:predicted TIM-barrel enzyme